MSSDEEAALRARAEVLGMQPREFLRSQMLPSIGRDGPLVTQTKLHAVRAERGVLEDMREGKTRERDFCLRVASKRAFAEFTDRAKELREELRAIEERISSLVHQEDELVRAAPAAALAVVPFWVVGASAFVLVAAVALVALWLWRRRAVLRARARGPGATLRERVADVASWEPPAERSVISSTEGEAAPADAQDRNIVKRGPDAGSPKPPRGHVASGRPLRLHVHETLMDPVVHKQRIQYVLDQPGGLEHLRRIFEDGQYETVDDAAPTAPLRVSALGAPPPAAATDPNRIGERDVVKIRILVFTDEDYRRIPFDVLRRAHSERARWFTDPVFDAARSAADASRGGITAPPPLDPAALPRRGPGRPRKDTPATVPPSNGKGHGNGNGNGHKAPGGL